jgi:hypothetical protein
MGERPDEISRAELGDAETIDRRGAAGENAEDISETSDDTTEIRAGIEQTRSEMSETIDAIQERLNPQHIKEQVKEQVREATIGRAEEAMRNAGDTLNEARYGLMETIRQNPIPAAMAGIGLGWLFMNRRSGARYRDQGYYRQGGQYYTGQPYGGERGYAGGQYGYRAEWREDDRGLLERGGQAIGSTVSRVQETAGDVAHRAQETVGDVAQRAQETVGNVVDQAQSTAGDVAQHAQEAAGYIADRAQFQAQRLEDRFERTLHENPLAVGAIALALGTAVGFTLPQTQRENELLGETRDNLIERAQTVAQDTVEKVQRVASEVIDEAQTTARESAREQGLTGQEQERGA